MQSNYLKVSKIVLQRKQDEVNLKKDVAELCLELSDMKLELEA